MNLAHVLRTLARRQGARPAVTSDGMILTYGAFDDQVARMAGALARRFGYESGARIGLWMENSVEFLVALYATWRAGLTAVPINAKLHAKELQWILANAEARICLVSPELGTRLGELGSGETLPEIIATDTTDYRRLIEAEPLASVPTDPEAEAWIFYTSGTTGRPKGAVLTHRNLLFMVHCYFADIDRLTPNDTILHAAPLSHGSGLYGLAFIAAGAQNVIVPGSFEPPRILEAIARHSDVSMFAAPTMVSRLMNHPAAGNADTRTLRTIVYGGAPMYQADAERALALLGPKLYQVYGQGESPMTITGLSKAEHADRNHPRFAERLASVGVARTGVAFRVVDEQGRELPPGEVGEVVTRSDCVMRGYWRNEEANARAIRDGWLWTGDVGSVDADGFLTLKDRSKDMIISGGSNIYPREIEEVLARHPAVLECAVVGRPHRDWGEEVIAFVVPRPGGTIAAADLDRLCIENIARFKRPRGWRLVDSLPKNNYGKILKTELRRQLDAETGAPAGDD